MKQAITLKVTHVSKGVVTLIRVEGTMFAMTMPTDDRNKAAKDGTFLRADIIRQSKTDANRRKAELDFTHCFYNPGDRYLIDMQHPHTGIAVYSHETLEQMRQRLPNVVVLTFEEANKRIDAATRVPAQPITEERWWEMWGMLPPLNPYYDGDTETFKFSEMSSGNVTMIFCRLGATYWELKDNFTLTHEEIVKRVRQAQTNLQS